MEDINFPIFKTKTKDSSKKFDLTDFNQRQAYFEYKAGPEIKKLRNYLKENTFVAFLLGKKSSGKGTYSKMFKEVVAPDKIEHFSVGDMVRSFDEIVKDKKKRKEFISFLEKNYRGFLPLQDIIKSLENRSTKTLLPTELILALVKREIEKLGKKAIFIDGFPRDLDQISYSLFFRDLIDYRQDPDVFILIDVPTTVIDERIKSRVVCPLCQTSRNLKLLPTKKVEYSEKDKKFHLICDNPNCPATQQAGKGSIMVTKEGDELGIKPIKERLDKDEILIKQALSLQGVPKILLRNSVPINKVKEFVDDYEITPGYSYVWDKKERKIEVIKKPWEFLDSQGVPSNSLMPPPVVVSLIKQLVKALDL
ncbi:nucleoside monophosphate kinase [Patescibacteria group bacterium]|nr:nucleoside monophosphate kinase [Patescibacteria group bacterium]MBU4367273.1 nucleoside monophosphate kinase [Patescibacteria group bacterium]MBU4462010.1 nucleoside monophosphate kinase [Patescibacteria group bacterium]MCG2700201.1 nucleoside monophosphate kinase [Candidatus Parcubacteria bacterium]